MRNIISILILLAAAPCSSQYIYWNTADTSQSLDRQSFGFLSVERDSLYYLYSRVSENWLDYFDVDIIDNLGQRTFLHRYPLPSSYLGGLGSSCFTVIRFGEDRYIHSACRSYFDSLDNQKWVPMFLYLNGGDSVGFEIDTTWAYLPHDLGNSPGPIIDWGDGEHFVSTEQWNPYSIAGSAGFRIVKRQFGGGIVSDHIWTQEGIDTLAINIVYAIKLTEDTLLVSGSLVTNDAPGSLGDRSNYLGKLPLSGDTLIYHVDGNPNACWEGGGALMRMENGHVLYIRSRCIEGILPEFVQSLRVAEIDPSSLEFIRDTVISLIPYDNVVTYGKSAAAIIEGSNGGYLAKINFQLLGGAQNANIFLKFNENLELEWRRDFVAPEGYTDPYIHNMSVTSDGGYLLCGEIRGASFPNVYPRSWSIKLDACGYQEPSGCPAFVGITEQQKQTIIQFWPNPTSGIAHAILPPFTNRINIRDVLGRVVYTEPVYYPRQDWNFDFLSPGHYLLEAVQEKGQTSATRFVVQGR